MDFTIDNISAYLASLAEPEYRDFSSSLVPGCGKMLGIRLPTLRLIAKRLAKEYGVDAVVRIGDGSFEETMLRGMVIGYLKLSPDELKPLMAEYANPLTNWSHCDCFVSGLKRIRLDRAAFVDFFEPYFSDAGEFRARFAEVSMLSHYTIPEYAPWALDMLFSVRHEGYYARMAKAWALCEFIIRVPDLAVPAIEKTKLEPEVYRMMVRKIRDSYRIPDETKRMFPLKQF